MMVPPISINVVLLLTSLDWYYSPPVTDYYYDQVTYEPVESNGFAQYKSEPVDLNYSENDRHSAQSFDSDSDSPEDEPQNDDSFDSRSLSETASQSHSLTEDYPNKLELFKRKQATERLRQFGEIFFEL